MRTESSVWYTSWTEAIEDLDEQDQLMAYRAIHIYQATHEEIEVNGAAKAIFRMAKPLCDSNYAKSQTNRLNGMKGGRPKASQSAKTEDKDDRKATVKTETKPKRNRNETEAKANRKPNGNVNGNGNGNDSTKNFQESDVVDCSPEFAKALKDYEDMRKKIRKPLTDSAKELILKELNRLSPNEKEQIQILNQSTMNSWQGLFPLKKKQVGLLDILDL